MLRTLQDVYVIRNNKHVYFRAIPAAFTITFSIVKQIKTGSVPVTGPVVAQRVGRGIVLLFHDRDTRRG